MSLKLSNELLTIRHSRNLEMLLTLEVTIFIVSPLINKITTNLSIMHHLLPFHVSRDFLSILSFSFILRKFGKDGETTHRIRCLYRIRYLYNLAMNQIETVSPLYLGYKRDRGRSTLSRWGAKLSLVFAIPSQNPW